MTMRRTLRSVIVALVLAAAGMAATPAAGEPELEGVYGAVGVNPDGSEYRAFVHIVRHGESFIVSWMFPAVSGEVVVFKPTSVGIGIANGGMLAVSYYTARMAGVIIYRIEEDGKRLAGQWTVVGEGGVIHAETLTRLPGVTPPPVEAEPPLDRAPRRRPSAGSVTSLSL
jgi:hypothetical protein